MTQHLVGAKTGLVDYISRNLFAEAKKISSYDEHVAVATTDKIRFVNNLLNINQKHYII